MANASRSRRLGSSADETWARVGGWDTIHEWHPAVSSTELQDGDLRKLTLGDGAVILERLVGQDDRSYTYRFVESPLPVAEYEATISVTPDGDGCVVTWEGSFEPAGIDEADAVAVVEGIYQAGLDAL